jgi:serine/threonine protein phosphatase PrpC
MSYYRTLDHTSGLLDDNVAKIELDVSGDSDIGCTRSENQDHYLIADLRRQIVIRQTDLPVNERDEMFGSCEGSLFIVADGMGGHNDGERASRTAVKATALYVLDMMHWFLKLNCDDEQDFVDELSNSLSVVQDRLWSQSDGSSRGMGTTVTMAYLLWPKMYVIHAGDSRCYLFRAGKLEQLTTDHTLAQQMLDAGAMSVEEAATSRWRHVLWNCVGGANASVRPEAIRVRLEVGDTLLLCSDGLNRMIDDTLIASILRDCETSGDAVAELVLAAKAAGGKDNISAIVCRILEQFKNECDESSTSDTTIIE